MQPQQSMPPVYGQQPYGSPQQGGVSPFQSPPPQRKRGVNGFMIATIILTLLLLGAIGFGVWAFMERDTYKNQTAKVVAKEVELATTQLSEQKDKAFLEDYKKPHKPYVGPTAYGSVKFEYPKTWSAYVNEAATGNTPIDGYFYPDFVPGLESGKQFALRLQVVSGAYDVQVKEFEKLVKEGKASIAPYTPKNVPTITGIRVDGELDKGVNGSMVILPLRDKTIKISSETKGFTKDLDTIILPSLTFIP